MRAWQLKESKLIVAEIPQPVPKAGEVLVHVRAGGVTPPELLWYPTTNTKSGEKRIGAVPGHEFSGTVDGQEVFGMNDWFADGSTADCCITRPEWIAPKPKNLTHAQAASVPIGALTAWQGLIDRARLQPGERVLIHGGSGAVGVFAIQFANQRGAHVITTASKRNQDFLLQLGARQVIDYHTEDFEKSVSEIDVVFDAVGGSTLQRSWRVLKPAGRLITVASDSEGTSDEKTKQAFFIVEPNQKQLIEMGELLQAGKLQTVVDCVVPFDQAGAAYERKIAPGIGRGKVVIEITAS